MTRSLFMIEGNICGDRIRIARTLHKPPLTQAELAVQIQLRGMEMTQVMISRIEKNNRHVIDAELLMISQVLGVSMEWLCGVGEDSDYLKFRIERR